ncbi:MAG TPA: hypothetical protein VHP11_06715, partial [Tepidisphaeraceae bacterium]|nr:hypothetical protein [Tepidisphaeraceae bacterium]
VNGIQDIAAVIKAFAEAEGFVVGVTAIIGAGKLLVFGRSGLYKPHRCPAGSPRADLQHLPARIPTALRKEVGLKASR